MFMRTEWSNPLTISSEVALQVVRTSFRFHLRECMGSSFPPPPPVLVTFFTSRSDAGPEGHVQRQCIGPQFVQMIITLLLVSARYLGLCSKTLLLSLRRKRRLLNGQSGVSKNRFFPEPVAT